MLEEKYITLLLKRCLCVKKNKPLFINYNTINKDFVEKLVEYARNIGVEDIYLDAVDSYDVHTKLSKFNLDEIEKCKDFNCKIWDEYAKKDSAFLILDTEIPSLMDDISSEKLEKYAVTKRNTKPLYREKQLKSLVPWCIASVPNEYWAKEVFPNSENPIKDFWDNLAKICMLNEKNPIKSWNNQLKKQANNVKKLNNLKIKKLHYKNNVGTDLEIELSENALWQSASSGKWIVNLPSYEIFTSPIYSKTNGIVYSSKPLVYNGKTIDNFSLEFKDGKVISFNAKEGKDILKEIINSDKLSAYLGEVAIVNYDSPISNTKLIFKSTLFDENASCHLALGSGFTECIKDGDKMDDQELDKVGINTSKTHVDFMIGTEDLLIEAETKKGKVIIMKDGNLII